MTTCLRLCMTAIFSLTSLLWSEAMAQDWPSLRGAHHDGSAATDDLELAAGPLQLKVAWKRKVGSGYSGVVVSGDRLISAMADVKSGQEFIFAMAATTGQVLWKTPTGKIMKGENGSFDGPIATPALDDTRAYHLSPFGNLSAYSLTDGSVIWSRHLKKEFSSEPNFYGFGASPLVHEGVLIVAAGSPDGAVMGFDPATGQVLWRAGKDGASFNSPVPMKVGNENVILVAGNTTLFAINPKNGNVLWSHPHGGADGEAVMSVNPVPIAGNGIFLNDQRNGSTALDLQPEGVSERWAGRALRNSYCLPVTSGGLLCSYSSRILTAVDPQTGRQLWRTRSPGDGFVATVAGRLLVATLNGALHIGDVSEEGFDEVASTQVFRLDDEDSDGLLWSLPSVAGRSVYLRSLGAIAKVDIEPGSKKRKAIVQKSQTGPEFKAFLESVASSDNKQATVDAYLHGKSTPLIEGDHVHFVLQGDYEDVALASELFGMRQERTMTRVDGTDLFFFGMKIPEKTRVSYLFFADYQPIVDAKNDRRVISSTVSGEMEPSFMEPEKPLTFSWFDKGDLASKLARNTDNPAKKLSGTMIQSTLESTHLKETLGLSIYLPQGYAESKARYPVVFVHEGQIAIESGNQAALVDELIQTNQIRPTIAVFIKKRFFPLQGADGYPQMFATELLPKIAKEYRISSHRDERASLSGGFGATLALMATLPATGEVGRIGCHSPYAFELLHPVIKQLAAIPGPRCQVRIQWGKYEPRNPSENWDMASQAKIVANILGDAGHSVSTEPTLTGSDWVCWRTQSAGMWRYLVGPAESQSK